MRDPGGWGWDYDPARARKSRLPEGFHGQDTLSSFRLDFERSFDSGFISAIDFGGNITERHKAAPRSRTPCASPRPATSAPTSQVPVPTSGYGYSINDFGYFGLDSLISWTRKRWSWRVLLTDPQRKQGHHEQGLDDQRTRRHAVRAGEDRYQPRFGGGHPEELVGVQAVNADQQSSGYRTSQDTRSAIRSPPGTKLHRLACRAGRLIFACHADQRALRRRRQMARPRMDDMRASDNVYVSQYDSALRRRVSAPCAGAQFR